MRHRRASALEHKVPPAAAQESDRLRWSVQIEVTCTHEREATVAQGRLPPNDLLRNTRARVSACCVSCSGTTALSL